MGPEKCAIAISISRDYLDIERIEPVVVGARLECELSSDANGRDDVSGQGKMIDTAVSIQSVADCPSLSIRPEKLGFRMSFAIGSIDVKSFASIAQKEGTVSITRIGDSGGDEGAVGDGAADSGDE